jgi:Ca2+-binding RTX toxin-like protein
MTVVLTGNSAYNDPNSTVDLTINGSSGNNSIVTGSGNDIISAGDGNDSVNAGAGNDFIDGGSGNDILIGGAGNDTIAGGVGNDTIAGGVGNDTITGGVGNDTVTGGVGDDILTGSSGNDTFVFNFSFQTESHTLSFDNTINTPTQLSGSNTNGVWSSYLDALSSWRAEQTAAHGADIDTASASATYTYGAGKLQQTKTVSYDDTFKFDTKVLISDGHDTIVDYSKLVAGSNSNIDALKFVGITAQQANEFMNVNNDGHDTVISWDGGSIKLLGVQYSSLDQIHDITYA